MDVSFGLLCRSLSSTFTGAYANLSRYARKKQKCRRVGEGGKDRGWGSKGGRGGVGFRGIEGDPRESPQLCLYVCCFRAWMTNL